MIRRRYRPLEDLKPHQLETLRELVDLGDAGVEPYRLRSHGRWSHSTMHALCRRGFAQLRRNDPGRVTRYVATNAGRERVLRDAAEASP